MNALAIAREDAIIFPSHYFVRYTPARGVDGEEQLVFDSSRRRIAIKGRRLREVYVSLLPLLDGTRTFEDLLHDDRITFDEAALEQCLSRLEQSGLIAAVSREVAGLDAGTARRLSPQTNFIHEVDRLPREVHYRLSQATVAVVGLSGPGMVAALALAAAGIGSLRLVDDSTVGDADLYLAPFLRSTAAGHSRSEALKAQIESEHWPGSVIPIVDAIDDDNGMIEAIGNADFVICAVEDDRANLRFMLNRACLAKSTPWTSCLSRGLEARFGPTVLPWDSACFVCYTMRAVACGEDAREEHVFQRYLADLDAKRGGDGRENLTFSSGLVGNLAALESFKALTSIGELSSLGALTTIDVWTGAWEKHFVLRKPWCPACTASEAVHHRDLSGE